MSDIKGVYIVVYDDFIEVSGVFSDKGVADEFCSNLNGPKGHDYHVVPFVLDAPASGLEKYMPKATK